MILKSTKQKIDVVKTTHPDLYESIQMNLKHLSDEDKGIVAGLVIEAVIKSDGDVEILEVADFANNNKFEEDFEDDTPIW